MDWKYKHFHQQRIFQASSDIIIEATRRVMSESLQWKVTETTEGLRAEGYSFTHAAIANFHFQPASEGIRIDVEVLVERAGSTGFMLFDVGGYYSIQIRKWLDAIQLNIHQEAAGTQGQSPPALPS